MKDYCDTFWGSHGCALKPGDGHTIHLCTWKRWDDDGENCIEEEPCTEYDETTDSVRYSTTDGWSEWMPLGGGDTTK